MFDRRQSGNYAALLALTIVALVIPSLFSHSIGLDIDIKVEVLSLGVVGTMILLYFLGVIYSTKYNTSRMTHPSGDHPQWSLKQACIILIVATLGLVWISELQSGKVEIVTSAPGISEFFLGILLIPIIGNVAEHLAAFQVANKKMDFSLEIAVSTSFQIVLLVAPILVLVSLLLGNPPTLILNRFELHALGAGVVITALVSLDGELIGWKGQPRWRCILSAD